MINSQTYGLQTEGSAYLASLRALDRSPNTERAYAGRVALYLSYCRSWGIDWAEPSFAALVGFGRWLVEEPLPDRGGQRRAEPLFRSGKTANAVMTVVAEFLRFGFSHGWVAAGTVALLVEPQWLRFVPPGYSVGESGQFRQVRARTIKFTEVEPGFRWLSPEQVHRLVELCRRARDRFLLTLLADTGMRIGEALGLRREDMHLLASSLDLGCQVAGPHVHVRRRRNPNGALAKARFPRTIPATAAVIDTYVEYQHERLVVAQAADSDVVFVNLFRSPLGRAMTYPNVKSLFDRLSRWAGFDVTPHMLRHAAATLWIRSGVDWDVVQALLGHVSPQSMAPYLHASDADMRAAVERAEAFRLSAARS